LDRHGRRHLGGAVPRDLGRTGVALAISPRDLRASNRDGARPEALRQGVKTGLEGGGASEPSAELLDSSDELARLDQQIAVLEERLASATVVQPNPADGELGVGEFARVRDLDTGELLDYRIVGAGEANPAAGSISYSSPVGSALLGRRVGDVIEVKVPSGLLHLEILEIEI
jgi:transcription elongation factor GreA